MYAFNDRADSVAYGFHNSILLWLIRHVHILRKTLGKCLKLVGTLIGVYNLSRCRRQPTICIYENKGADQLCSYCENKAADQLCINCTADQRLCFRSLDSAIPLFLNLKFQGFNFFIWLNSLVCVGPGQKVQVGKDQEKAQSEKDSHSKNRGGKKPN